jgi:hypothetical protein
MHPQLSGQPGHTPGPWKWDGPNLAPAEPDPQRYAVHTIVTCSSGGYGFLASKHAQTAAELDADRLLIAAAPDLLVALRNLACACDVALDGSAALVAAHAAIAKASGGDA